MTQRREHKRGNTLQSPATAWLKMSGRGRGGIGVTAGTEPSTGAPSPNTAHPTAAAWLGHILNTQHKGWGSSKCVRFLKGPGCCPSWSITSLRYHPVPTVLLLGTTAGHRHPHFVCHGMEPGMQKHSQNKDKHCQTTVQRATVQGKQQEIVLIYFF